MGYGARGAGRRHSSQRDAALRGRAARRPLRSECTVATALCRHFGPCGGCDWQNLAYAEQLWRKRARLEDLLRASMGARARTVRPVVGMRVDETGWPWRFRHKGAFVFGESDDGRVPTIGHLRRPVARSGRHHGMSGARGPCQPARVRAARPSRTGARPGGRSEPARACCVISSFAPRATPEKSAPCSSSRATTSHCASQSKHFSATEEAPDGFYLNIHDRPGPYMVGRETMQAVGPQPRQGNRQRLLVPAVADRVLSDERRCGRRHRPPRARGGCRTRNRSGFSISIPAADYSPCHSRRAAIVVTAVEENRQAIEDADANLRLNRVPAGHVRLHAARVEDALPRLARESFDCVILDPPRQGCPAGGDPPRLRPDQARAASSTSRATPRRSPQRCR